MDLVDVEVSAEAGPRVPTRMTELWQQPRTPGKFALHFSVPATATSLWIPSCGRRGTTKLAGVLLPEPDAGPFVAFVGAAAAPRELVIELTASDYEKRLACGAAPRAGEAYGSARSGFFDLTYPSPNARACRGACTPGHALVYIPANLSAGPQPLLIGVHPWNGTIFTYAAYRQLIAEADRMGMMLLMPSGLGNSLYVAAAEDEVMRALAAFELVRNVDPARISLWGASMGGQGATTIGFHHPDRFAFIASFFGDARLPRKGYLLGYFPTEEDARRVNPADAGDNARYLPTWLLHGDADRTAKVGESDILHRELKERDYPVRYDRLPGRGHEGRMVEDYIAQMVQYASVMRIASNIPRVTYRALRPTDKGAYGVTLVRRDASKEAFVDIGYDAASSTWKVYGATNIAELQLAPGAFGVVSIAPATVGTAPLQVRIAPAPAPPMPSVP